MPREYRHISEYKKEIYELREKGLNLNEIEKQLGFTHEQVRGFIRRENRNKRKIEAGITLKRKGRPPKDYVVREEDKIAELRYILARKEAKIKSLEMKNELMRDFLSLTERK